MIASITGHSPWIIVWILGSLFVAWALCRANGEDAP